MRGQFAGISSCLRVYRSKWQHDIQHSNMKTTTVFPTLGCFLPWQCWPFDFLWFPHYEKIEKCWFHRLPNTKTLNYLWHNLLGQQAGLLPRSETPRLPLLQECRVRVVLVLWVWNTQHSASGVRKAATRLCLEDVSSGDVAAILWIRLVCHTCNIYINIPKWPEPVDCHGCRKSKQPKVSQISPSHVVVTQKRRSAYMLVVSWCKGLWHLFLLMIMIQTSWAHLETFC